MSCSGHPTGIFEHSDLILLALLPGFKRAISLVSSQIGCFSPLGFSGCSRVKRCLNCECGTSWGVGSDFCTAVLAQCSPDRAFVQSLWPGACSGFNLPDTSSLCSIELKNKLEVSTWVSYWFWGFRIVHHPKQEHNLPKLSDIHWQSGKKHLSGCEDAWSSSKLY